MLENIAYNKGYSKIAQKASEALKYLIVPLFKLKHQFYLMIGIQPSAHRVVIRHDGTRDRCTTIPVKVKDRCWFWIWHSDGIIFGFIQTLFSCTKFLIQFSAKFFEFLILGCQFVHFRYQLWRVIVRSFVCSITLFSGDESYLWVIGCKRSIWYGTYSYRGHLWLLIDQYLDFLFEQWEIWSWQDPFQEYLFRHDDVSILLPPEWNDF